MFTFLFDDYRARIMGKYKSRFAIIYAFMLGVLFIFGSVLTIPTYILLESRLSAAKLEDSVIVKTSSETGAPIDSEITAIKRRISVIEIDSAEVPIGTILERILSKKGNDIRIEGIALRRNSERGSISITGVAPSRDSLVALSKRLQGEPSFINVDLPVGSLTRSKDVPFTINIDSKI